MRTHHRVTDSTNLRARALAEAGAPHFTVVTASEQTAGRGRQGRSWSAPAGEALLVSVVLRTWGRLLPLAAAVAVCDLDERLRVKWPNDIWLDGRKVAGILVETRHGESWAVLGIGVNVAVDLESMPADLQSTAGTLGLTRADVEPTLTRLLDALERWLHAPPDHVLAAFRARDALRGRRVEWAGGAGTAMGVDDAGNLLVDGEDGARHALGAGEVHLAHVW